MKTWIGCLTLTAVASAGVSAQDAGAGKARAEAVCSACHGLNGVSVADNIPNLAGQKSAYLASQLRQLKDGSRKNAVMGAIAAQLSPEDIANVAAYFSSLPGAGTSTAKSDFLPNLSTTKVGFPENYRSTFTLYQTVNRPDINQVRYLYANPVALQAAKEGKALPDGSVLVLEQFAAKQGADKKPVAGANGFFEPERFVAFAVMERREGWGSSVPEMLRNENWNYAVFTADKKHRPGVNQAECLACHKPLDKKSFTFSIDPLTTVAKR
ncbi:MAG TPA: cytochrome P460 family protein [Burkholderiaceae bacterium]